MFPLLHMRRWRPRIVCAAAAVGLLAAILATGGTAAVSGPAFATPV